MYLQNAWYVAAWDREIGREPLARTLLDQQVVLYRTQDGTPAALEDRCCHRHLPLSLGTVIGEELQCGYHGLRFDTTGACVGLPGPSKVPPGAAVRAYPVAERWGWVWIWMGEPERADLSKIPDFWYMDHPDWACARPDVMHLAYSYRLIAAERDGAAA